MSRFTYLLKFAFSIMLMVWAAPLAWTQASTGQASGTIRDQTSAVMPGVRVTLTNQDTNETSKTATNGEGFYVFPGLVPGRYLLVVEAPGMGKFEGSLTVQ